MNRCKIYYGGKQYEISFTEAGSLLELVRGAGLPVSAPCGGNGTCGKCRVTAIGALSPLTQEELDKLTKEEITEKVRLACCAKPMGDVEIRLFDTASAQILDDFYQNSDEPLSPVLKVSEVTLPAPGLIGKNADCYRLADALNVPVCFTVNALRELSCLKGETVQTVSYQNQIISITEPANPVYAAAVDIGTTTVCIYIVDVIQQKIIDKCTRLNEQSPFGADVISRIGASSQPENLQKMRELLIGQINEMTRGYPLSLITFAGNTTMLHTLLGVNPEHIAAAPFNPVFTHGFSCPASELGLQLNSGCMAHILPGLASYVGADITAGILACGMMDSESYSLLVDIGTNGEIALGNSEKILCCGTAAGPAFEGAKIACGCGAVSGAVNTIRWDSESFSITTIGNLPAIGICGSAIIDAAAFLSDTGFIDETGRFDEEYEGPFAANVFEMNGQPAFRLTESVYVTQQDIREIQLAKAAIAAGIATLLNNAGLSFEQIGTLYLAGGFGNYINRNNAAAIGLIPPELKEKLIPAGNASASGAALCILSEPAVQRLPGIVQAAEYIELSASPVFQQQYMEQMYF